VASSTFPENFNDNSIAQPVKKKGRSALSDVLKRSQRLYARQLEGKTTRQLVIEHSNIEGVSETIGWQDWNRVKVWNTADWEKDRESLLPRLQGMRIRLFNKAVKKGQLQTAAQILDSLGKVIGESVETVNIQAPELAIRIEPKN
jgi:hypothetical protein